MKQQRQGQPTRFVGVRLPLDVLEQLPPARRGVGRNGGGRSAAIVALLREALAMRKRRAEANGEA